VLYFTFTPRFHFLSKVWSIILYFNLLLLLVSLDAGSVHILLRGWSCPAH
jgi:hypothetical protein